MDHYFYKSKQRLKGRDLPGKSPQLEIESEYTKEDTDSDLGRELVG